MGEEDLLKLEDILMLYATLEAYNDALIRVLRLMQDYVFSRITTPPALEEFRICMPEEAREKLLNLIEDFKYHKALIITNVEEILEVLGNVAQEYYRKVRDELTKGQEG